MFCVCLCIHVFMHGAHKASLDGAGSSAWKDALLSLRFKMLMRINVYSWGQVFFHFFCEVINDLKHFPFGLNPTILVVYIYCVSSCLFGCVYSLGFPRSCRCTLLHLDFSGLSVVCVASCSPCIVIKCLLFFLVAARVNRCQGRRSPLLLHGGIDHTQTYTHFKGLNPQAALWAMLWLCKNVLKKST